MYYKMKKELNKLWTGEFASVLVFWICYFILAKKHTIQVIYPLSVLSFILLQGSVYWILCLNRLIKQKNYGSYVGKCYFVLKHINMMLFLAYIPILGISPETSIMYYIVGIFLSLFAFVEFVNYFLYRLSYKNVAILISQINSKTLRKSRLAKEIENARLQL